MDTETKNKLINKEKSNVVDFVKNPIMIKNNNNYEIMSEKILKKLILEDIEFFMKELGNLSNTKIYRINDSGSILKIIV